MWHRRNFLKAVTSPALAAPWLPRAGFGQSAAAPLVPGLPDPGDPRYWDRVRDQFMLARDKVFFNNGTIGVMPKVVVNRMVEHLHKMATDIADWDYVPGEEWISGYGPMTEIRTKAARLLNCDVKEVGLTENVTAGASYIAAGLNLEPGAEILITNAEHEGGRSGWLLEAKRHKGVVTQVRLPDNPIHSPEQVVEVFKKAITPQTKVIAISHVITGTGAILPVKEICAEARSRGIFTVLDGAQAFGHIKVDLKDIGCDAYVGCFHKWILAPAGSGFIYLRADRTNDVWASVASGQWDNHQDDGYRFTQRGTGNLSLMMGLDAALDFQFAIGPERIQQRIKYLGEYLRDGLRKIPKVKMTSPDNPAMVAAITVYRVDGVSPQKLNTEMWNRDRLRPRGARHCTHIYNSTQEIDRALAVIRSVAQA
jgi:selenocysteine lyase/cysteine desulfurase